MVTIAFISAFGVLFVSVLAHLVYLARKQRQARVAEQTTPQWTTVVKQVRLRRKALQEVMQPSSESTADSLGWEASKGLELAATDLFVEKVQIKLTERGDEHQLLGTFYGHGVFLILCVTSLYLSTVAPLPVYDLDWAYVVGRTLQMGAAVGLFLGAAFFLGSLARAHLHEATVLYNRRHTVRLGRLFLYLKFGDLSPESMSKAKESLSIDEMERCIRFCP